MAVELLTNPDDEESDTVNCSFATFPPPRLQVVRVMTAELLAPTNVLPDAGETSTPEVQPLEPTVAGAEPLPLTVQNAVVLTPVLKFWIVNEQVVLRPHVTLVVWKETPLVVPNPLVTQTPLMNEVHPLVPMPVLVQTPLTIEPQEDPPLRSIRPRPSLSLMLAFRGLLKRTRKSRLEISLTFRLKARTVMVFVVSPGLNVSVPLPA